MLDSPHWPVSSLEPKIRLISFRSLVLVQYSTLVQDRCFFCRETKELLMCERLSLRSSLERPGMWRPVAQDGND